MCDEKRVNRSEQLFFSRLKDANDEQRTVMIQIRGDFNAVAIAFGRIINVLGPELKGLGTLQRTRTKPSGKKAMFVIQPNFDEAASGK